MWLTSLRRIVLIGPSFLLLCTQFRFGGLLLRSSVTSTSFQTFKLSWTSKVQVTIKINLDFRVYR